MQLAVPQIIAGTKLLLTVVSPLQSIIDRPGKTHEFCNRQALTILRNDGYTDCATFIEKYLQEFNAGVYWADQGWKNVSHYFVPSSGSGLWHFSNAVEEYSAFIAQAKAKIINHDYGRAVFFLGAAVHLVQDLCVPHHARSKLFCGHKEYEQWAEKNCVRYAIREQGLYNDSLTSDRLIKNAATAADMLPLVNEQASGSDYHKATSVLLPMAQQSTAGMLQQFFACNIEKSLTKALFSRSIVA